MSTKFQVKTEILANKGILLKKDPGTLADGEMSELTNMISVQEGALTTRTGNQRLTGGSSPTFSTHYFLFNTISKLHGSNPDARYFGHSTSIYRATGALPVAGATLTLTAVASDIASNSVSDYTQLRWAGIQYNAGSIGTPYEFFATPGKMLKDTGALTTSPGDQFNNPPNSVPPANYGPGNDGTVLNQWGILPPWQPAIAFLGVITILPNNTSDLIASVAGPTHRISVTVSSFAYTSGSAPGYVTITPSNMIDPVTSAPIENGILLLIATGSGNYAMSVTQTTATTFSGYLGSPSSPTVSGTILSYETTQTSSAPFPNIGPVTINAAFNGTAANAYVTDNLVHFAIYVSNPPSITDMRMRVFVNGTNSDGSGSDYYEKAVAVNSLQSQVSGTTPASTANSNTVLTDVTIGSLGTFEISLPAINQSIPEQLTNVSAITATTQVWSEFDVPISQFLPVGNAGSGKSTWQNVTGFQLYYVTNPATDTGLIVSLSSLYIYGGYGPNNNNVFTNTTQLLPYTYCFTYRNPITGAESSPSIPMIVANGVMATNQAIAVVCAPTGDPQVTGGQSIAVYRAGGSFADGFYRLVGYTANTGFSGSGGGASPNASAIYIDTSSDISLNSAPTADFDNDPPVTSTLPVQYSSTISSMSGGFPNAGSLVDISPAVMPPVLRIGSTITLFSGSTQASNFEQCIVANVNATTFRVYIQFNHVIGDTITCSAVSNQPCSLGVAAFDSIFLAGDPNNPHVLYKSKTGRPEAFPVVEIATGNVNQINVGSPSDPIMNLTEFNGEIVCLNLSHIYIVQVFYGQMQAPIATPANRGLTGTYAWCRADNEIWYLAYDGIYSWSGGQSYKRSEAIDPIFKGYTTGGPAEQTYPPIDLTQANKITFAYYKNEILVNYIDQTSIYRRLRYNIPWNRWWVEVLNDTLNTQNPPALALTAQYVEPDTGNLLIAKSMQISSSTWAFIYLDDVGTSDGWLNSGNDGAVIVYAATPASYTLGLPSVNKQFADIDLEFNNDSSASQFSVYYDFSSIATENPVIAAGSSQGRRRQQFSLNNGFGAEAYALTVRFHGSTVVPLWFYSLTFNYIDLQQLQVGRAIEWDDLGYEYDKRLYELVITHDVAGGQTVTLNLDIETGLNGSQQITSGYQTFTLLPVQAGAGSSPNRVTSNFPISDGTVVKRIRIRPTVAITPFKIWDYKFKFEQYPPDIVPFTEYSDYGHPYDKHFFVLWLNVDTNNLPVNVTIQADGNTSVQTVTVTGTFNNRAVPFAVNVDVIGKLVRLFVGTIPSGGKFQLFDHHFDFEKFPADAIYNTEYRDFGYPYYKYVQQLILDVNTNNQVVPVQVVGDGNVLQTVNVQSTIQTRDQLLTLNPVRDGNGVPVAVRKLRLVVQPGTIPAGGRFQLWTWDIMHTQADLGPVTHTTDWDNMKWPYDKQLQEITFEYDNNAVSPVTMLMDTETGINGGTITILAFSFVLNQSTRAIQTFAFPDNTYVKQVRVYPASDFVSWRSWRYKIVGINQPADIVEFTNWSDLGWPCDKIARNLILNINTNGVTAFVSLLADGGVLETFAVTTTYSNRYVVFATSSNLIGKLWKLELSPGAGGSTQLFDWKLDYVKEPCAVNYYDSYETAMGVNNWKFLKQAWVHYTSTASITVTIFREDDVAFYSITLPLQATRDMQRFYFPASVAGVLSRTYRFQITSSGLFKLYADSRIDFGIFGEDQMGAFKLGAANAEMQLPVASPVMGSSAATV